MNTFEAVDLARAAATEDTYCILEIEHRDLGRCFIRSRAGRKPFEAALRRKPMAEIERVVAEHSLLSAAEQVAMEAEIEAEVARDLEHNTRCHRCGCHVDGQTAYSQKEWMRIGAAKVQVATYYCDGCKSLLCGIGAGEHTAMEERAATVPSYEPYTFSDGE